MASSFTIATPEIVEYISKRFNAEDEFLQKLRADSVEAGMPAINIGGEQGAFLQVQLLAMQAKHILEIGSLGGYSAITMARVIPADGTITCLEKDEQYCAFIRQKADEAGIGDKFHIYSGPATDFLQTHQPQNLYDFVFIDADKPNYSNYLNLVLPMVRTGGVIAADNTLAWGEIANETTNFEPRNVYALQQYNQFVSGHPQLTSCLVPVGDGMTISVKRK